jgi:hypothetical protein
VARIYDLVMTHKLDTDDFFIHCIQRHCAEARLNFFLIEPLWAKVFFEGLEKNEVWARVLLNMHSEHHEPDEVFHRIVRLAAERQTQMIDHPDVALESFDKSRVHTRLIGAGINTPYTVIVPGERTSSFQLSDEQRAALGTPFVIKPAMGYGRRGVVMNALSEKDLARSVTGWLGHFIQELEHSEHHLPSPAGWLKTNYLLQKKVVPRQINGSPAYFRVYFVFGSVFYCWWNCYTDQYRQLTPQEAQEHNLKPLEEIIRQIANVTHMKFFSSEIAQVESGDFVVIDYVNDQCHMLSQTANALIGVPDGLVAAIAKRLVEGAQELIRNGKA